MAVAVKMPKLSDTMTEGVILKWLKKEGEKVTQGDIIVEIESDKADMELEAFDTGTLRKIVVPEGGKAPIGSLIAVIGEPSEDISSVLASASMANVESQAAPAQKPPLAAASAPQVMSEPASTAPAPKGQPTDGRIKASPLAKRLASEHKLTIQSIPGSGPLGRVIKRDIEAALSGKIPLTPTSQVITPGTAEEVSLSPIRKTIAKRMAESKQSAPHFYVTIEADMDAAIAFRNQLNNVFEAKISFTDIIIKACASALMRHPQVNATFLGDKMRQHHYVHIGVAVALEDGLVTPILRNCEQKGIGRINQELRDLVDRARNRKLKPDEYQGATFTISNLGMFGVEDFVAIINPPEGAILAVGAILEKPVVKDGHVVVGHTMRVTLSSDHRIIDGAIAARFLQDLKKMLENPAALVSIT
ncbi:MAG: pyruvate dehydrogenase complex dihydrolipoamide acetyltransferase [Ignavibacteriales bacterium]|nr:pyruvate dehydrogenase complex dihydrolipoamide acetyltransferase [Ignavibacteriales bacterium]